MSDYNKDLSASREESDRLTRDLRVCMACVVVNVNDCTVDVMPAFEERIMSKSGRGVTHEPMQIIEDVPKPIIGGIDFEVNEGDHGLIFFHDVSLDDYLDTEAVRPLEGVSRHHDYTDAVYLPFDLRCSSKAKARISVTADSVTVGDVVIEEDEITIGETKVLQKLRELEALHGGLFGGLL